jgi:hypothetical protein
MNMPRPVVPAVLAVGTLLLFGTVTAAQEPPTAAQLEALCEANAPEGDGRTTCLDVVHRYLVPGSGPSLGYAYTDSNLAVTLVGVDWTTPEAPVPPDEGRQLVSIQVRYEALQDADYSSDDDWAVRDQAGQEGDSIESPKSPSLQGGQLAAGQTAEGWMTFSVPAGSTTLDVSYRDGMFGDEHHWTLTQGRSAGPVAQATPRPTRKPAATPKPTPAPGLGDSYVDETLRVTVRRVDWNTRSMFLKPDAGKQWVSILVRYTARQNADYNAFEDWKVIDQDGFDGGTVLFTPAEPGLTDGRLRKGRSVEGWITFEFSEGVKRITVMYTDGLFGDEHVWVVRRRR